MPLTAAKRAALAGAGQGHILEHLDRLNGAAHARLAAQLEGVDLDLHRRLHELTTQPPATGGTLSPPDLFPLQRDAAQEREAERARERGEALLAAGRVGFVLVAGGQASRLGYDAPKGEFPVGPVTGRTLFAYHAQRILAARARSGCSLPWYVMTSPVNDAATKACFERADYFGLPREDVFFFSQDLLPAMDAAGRLLLAAPDSLFLAPNGHGGSLLALATSGALADMRARGVDTLSYFQVDNPLAPPADPLFLGLHDLADGEMSTKVVEKRDAAEKVGVIGRIDGRLGCIEYSDLPEELREARDASGRLRFRAGNIAMHALSVSFLERVTGGELELPWHVARKRMRALGADGEFVEVEGFKFETFVFDALGLAERSVTLEVDRALEFSPVKNREGEDSPATARADLCALFASWARSAGRPLPPADDDGVIPVEVDPRLAENATEFAARAGEPREVGGGHVYEP